MKRKIIHDLNNLIQVAMFKNSVLVKLLTELKRQIESGELDHLIGDKND